MNRGLAFCWLVVVLFVLLFVFKGLAHPRLVAGQFKILKDLGNLKQQSGAGAVVFESEFVSCFQGLS